MNDIKLIRLVNGSDILCEITEDSEYNYILREPLAVDYVVDGRGMKSIYFSPWLPSSMIIDNFARIRKTDVLTIMNPTEVVIENYCRAVLSMLSDKKNNTYISDDELSAEFDFDEETLDEEGEEDDIQDILELQEAINNLKKHITYH